MKWEIQSKSALFSKRQNDIFEVSNSDLNLIRNSKESDNRFCNRLCLHADGDAPLQQMIISHKKDTYIPPHRVNKSGEGSYLVLEGALVLSTFSDSGTQEQTIQLSSFDKNEMFLFWLPSNKFRAQIFLEDTIFIETRLGPFRESEKEIADWAPSKENIELTES
ncbi:MAG: hypothetical protein CL402_09715 [Acidiferrobacteraceae bacterium]|nr:hypothetical protein [Acidiferrobacteraceae bacterium]|tara:strand:- start:3211 stop:3702 length:492 start_codon:yes stop_codon:yes gene_type:complete